VPAAGASSVSQELPDCYSAFEAEFDFVHRMLRRYGASPSDAEDLAQEVFLVVWRRWRDYDQQRPLRPWLAGIAFRVAHDHFRRVRREVPSGFVDGEDQASPLDHLASARARALVLRALAALPARQRAILILHELEGIPIPELVGTLLVPASTLYSRLKKAHQSFARSVRRLQRGATPAPALIEAEALLAAERTPRPEPPERRRRVMARVRALLASPRPPLRTAPPRGIPAWPVLAAAGLLVLGAVAWRALGHRRHPARPQLAVAAAPAQRIVPPPAAPRLDQGLVGYWRFDEGAGTVAADRSGNGVDCALRQMSPASWIQGPRVGALQFGGLGWLSCAQPRFAGDSADLSVSVWVKRTQSPRGYHAIVTRQVRDTNLDHFFLGFRGDLIFFVSHLWGGKIHHPAPPLDHWFHLAVVHGNRAAVMFVDGVEVARAPTYDDRPARTETPLTMGGGANGPDPDLVKQRLVGAVDELAIYDRQLSPDEVKRLASGAQPR
jgi:RNA polymerase sigma-70 factor (ECF subfamily)